MERGGRGRSRERERENNEIRGTIRDTERE